MVNVFRHWTEHFFGPIWSQGVPSRFGGPGQNFPIPFHWYQALQIISHEESYGGNLAPPPLPHFLDLFDFFVLAVMLAARPLSMSLLKIF